MHDRILDESADRKLLVIAHLHFFCLRFKRCDSCVAKYPTRRLYPTRNKSHPGELKLTKFHGQYWSHKPDTSPSTFQSSINWWSKVRHAASRREFYGGQRRHESTNTVTLIQERSRNTFASQFAHIKDCFRRLRASLNKKPKAAAQAWLHTVPLNKT